MIALLILAFFIIQNKPEDFGLLPDNDPASVEAVKAMKEEMENYKSPWTIKRILKDKDVWLSGIGYALLFMATVGLVSRFIPRAVSVGFEQSAATALLSIAALIGIVASYFWGVVDTKFGTKTASILLGAWFVAGFILNICPGKPMFILSAVFLGCALGGNTNFSTSMCSSLFGRKNFQRAFNIVFPLSCTGRAAGTFLLGVILAATGNSFVAAYVVFMIGSIIAMITLSRNRCIVHHLNLKHKG